MKRKIAVDVGAPKRINYFLFIFVITPFLQILLRLVCKCTHPREPFLFEQEKMKFNVQEEARGKKATSSNPRRDEALNFIFNYSQQFVSVIKSLVTQRLFSTHLV